MDTIIQNKHFKINNLLNSTLYHNSSTIPPYTPNFVTAKADSGATTHSFSSNHYQYLNNVTPLIDGPSVKLPNGTTMIPKHTGQLNLSTLSDNAKKVHIHKNLNDTALISIGQLCDDGCVATFDKKSLKILKNNTLILQGNRNTNDGLWDIQLPPKKSNIPTTSCINAIVRKDITTQKLAQYLHGCAGSPSLGTFQHAIDRGNFISWPGIETIKFKKYIPNPEATAKGHLQQERKGLQSTRDDNNDHFPAQESKTKNVFATAFSFSEKELTYTDQTGKFPFKSSRGNQYIMILYDYDSNAILAKAVKTRQAKDLSDTWKQLYNDLTRNGHTTKTFIMDNECSSDMKNALKKYSLNYQLVPPDMHRRNAAERAIRTFKNHFLSALATCNKHFPIQEWDLLIPQAVLTLNLLRNARINPQLSSHAFLFGVHDFNKHPLAPFGTKVMIHNKSNHRGSWEYRATEGWYVGPSTEHYRCFKCYKPLTKEVVISDTVQLIEENIPLPVAKLDDYLRQAVDDILSILKQPQATTLPFLQYGNDTKNAIVKVAGLLKKAVQRPTNDNTLPRVKSEVSTIKDVNVDDIPPPIHVKRPLQVLQDLKTTLETSAVCPHRQKQLLSKKAKKSAVIKPQRSTLKPSSSTHAPMLNDHHYQTTPQSYNNTFINPNYQQFHQPTYFYPFRNTRLPFAPMASYSTPSMFHIFDDNGKKMSIDQLLSGKDKIKWNRGLDNELGRLSDGIPNRLKGTNTLKFIRKEDIPRGRKITYANFVCDIKLHKAEQYRVRLTIGGDKLEYFLETASPAANILETKILINSVISDTKKGARFLTLDIKDFFLQSDLPTKEYIRIHSKYFSKFFRDLYGLHNKIADNGYIYCEISKGMYGLKQAAILAYKKLKGILEKAGYVPVPNTTGLWKHSERKTIFALCVDDFGVKYFSDTDVKHLMATLQQHYVITIDRTGTNYCGLSFDWNYEKGYVDVSMPKYVEKALDKYNHSPPNKPQHAPHVWAAKFYGTKPQKATPEDTTKQLVGKAIRNVQSKIGTFLFYGRAVDPTILPALGEISLKQSSPTEKTENELNMLMDYLHTYPSAVLRYYAGTMQLIVESDAAYLVLPGAKSRIAGYYILENSTNKKTPSPLFIECKAIRHVVCSAAEAETHGLFVNCQNAIIIKNALEGIGHKQRKIKVSTDNTTSTGFVNNTMKEKRSKTWDMRYNWLRDVPAKLNFDIIWKKGTENMADYFTKNHPPSHHKEKRKQYVLESEKINLLSEFINKFC